MINKFKNTKNYLDNSLSKKIIKILRMEINRKRARGGYTSKIAFEGKLSDSLKNKMRSNSGGFSLDIEGLGYGLDLDDGGNYPRRRPPVEKILHWIKTKPVNLTDFGGRTLTESRIKGIAYLISKKIGLHGIKPTNYLDDAIEQILLEIDEITDPIVEDVILNIEDILLKAGYIKKGDNYIIEHGN